MFLYSLSPEGPCTNWIMSQSCLLSASAFFLHAKAVAARSSSEPLKCSNHFGLRALASASLISAQAPANLEIAWLVSRPALIRLRIELTAELATPRAVIGSSIFQTPRTNFCRIHPIENRVRAVVTNVITVLECPGSRALDELLSPHNEDQIANHGDIFMSMLTSIRIIAPDADKMMF